MTSRIFRSIFSVAVAVLAASLFIVTAVLCRYFENIEAEQLKDELSLSAGAVEQLGEAYLQNLEAERYRLTWVSPDGRVLFDSHADETGMENHADREEIREALISGSGNSVRQSSTLTEKTIYRALRLNDGSVLRISVSRATALMLVLGMLPPIILVLLFATALSSYLAQRMARRVVEPLNDLDLDRPLENEAYDELSPLLHRIHAQHEEIENKLRTLKQKEDEFDQITGSMKEALILLDSRGRILSINPAARTLFSTGGACFGEDFLSLERRQSMRQALEQAKAQGHWEFREKINGKEYQFDLSRIDSATDEPGMVILAFDISEQINAERNRREFTANVSHELKTPLQSIIGSAELLENGIVRTEDISRFVGHIHKEAARLVALIDDIILLSHLDEEADMPREEFCLRELAEEVCESLADAAAQKGLSMEVKGDAGMMKGVRRLIYELIYNLCDNAIKYNREGGSVKVSVTEKGDELTLNVLDSGIGIPTEHLDKIFERFYRVDKSHSRQSGGTGLGLSIAKHAAQYHHGKISVKSEAGKGSLFSVLFDRNSL